MLYFQSIITIGTINIIMIIGLAILTGYTGLFSLGNVGFMMIGAYASVIVQRYLHMPYLLSLIAGGLAAMTAGFLIGFPAVRSKLKGDHFAIAMLGFANAIRVIISNTKNRYVNGALGIMNIPKITNMWWALGIAAVIIWMLSNYVHSAYGRNCRAIREQEVAAEIMGIQVSRTKLYSVLINGFCTGMGGGMFAFYTTIIQPGMFAQNLSSNHLIAVVFGGINSIVGPVMASFLLAILPEMLRFISKWRLVIYGVLIVTIMLVRPEGLLGYKELSFKWVGKLCRGEYDLKRLPANAKARFKAMFTKKDSNEGGGGH